ncbi:hypothetical protein Tco_1543736, partial [Tanacetum coccineum]
TDSRVLRAAGISAIEVLEASRAYWFRALSAATNSSMIFTSQSAIKVLEASRAYWFRVLSAICHNKFING